MNDDEQAELFDSRETTVWYRIAECVLWTVLILVIFAVALLGEDVGLTLVSAIVLLVLWARNRRHHRPLKKSATVKIGTGAPGYVEIWGEAEPADSRVLRDPLTDEPCLWFGVRTRHKMGDSARPGWVEVKKASSWRPFLLRDNTGTCRVIPEGVEMRMRPIEPISAGPNVRHELWRIRKGDRICVLGRLSGPVGQLRTIEKPAGRAPYLFSDQSPWRLTRNLTRISLGLLARIFITILVVLVYLAIRLR